METIEISGVTYKIIPPEDQDFTGKLALIRKGAINPAYHAPEQRLVRCEAGFGCNPTATGRAVYVEFIADGEDSRWNRNQIECVLEPVEGGTV